MGDLVPMQIKHFQIREPAQDFFLELDKSLWSFGGRRTSKMIQEVLAKIRFGYVLLKCFTMSPLSSHEIVICRSNSFMSIDGIGDENDEDNSLKDVIGDLFNVVEREIEPGDLLRCFHEVQGELHVEREIL